MVKLIPELLPVRLMAESEAKNRRAHHDRWCDHDWWRHIDLRTGFDIRRTGLNIRRRRNHHRGRWDWYPNTEPDACLRDRYRPE